MKTKFSTKWKASKQPRKQRKYLANAPNHLKKKQLSATLSRELRKKHGRRSIELRKNDEVKVMRGKLKGKQGKITEVNTKTGKVALEGLQRTKNDGTKINVWFHASKVKIVSLDSSDNKRIKLKKETKNLETGEQNAHKTK